MSSHGRRGRTSCSLRQQMPCITPTERTGTRVVFQWGLLRQGFAISRNSCDTSSPPGFGSVGDSGEDRLCWRRRQPKMRMARGKCYVPEYRTVRLYQVHLHGRLVPGASVGAGWSPAQCRFRRRPGAGAGDGSAARYWLGPRRGYQPAPSRSVVLVQPQLSAKALPHREGFFVCRLPLGGVKPSPSGDGNHAKSARARSGPEDSEALLISGIGLLCS